MLLIDDTSRVHRNAGNALTFADLLFSHNVDLGYATQRMDSVGDTNGFKMRYQFYVMGDEQQNERTKLKVRSACVDA